jgi:hypothetical protein
MAFFLARAAEAADKPRVAPLPRHNGREELLPDCEAKLRCRDRIDVVKFCEDTVKCGSEAEAHWPYRGACFSMRGKLIMVFCACLR